MGKKINHVVEESSIQQERHKEYSFFSPQREKRARIGSNLQETLFVPFQHLSDTHILNKSTIYECHIF